MKKKTPITFGTFFALSLSRATLTLSPGFSCASSIREAASSRDPLRSLLGRGESRSLVSENASGQREQKKA